MHLSESVEEVEFIRTGGGPWRALLEELGAWDPAWTAAGGVSPVQFLDESGFLDARVLAVHGVQMTPADLARLAARGATLVTCPRSNGHTGAGAPPIEDFYASGVRVAVGTDSLASAPDLNVFAELATLRALAPSVPASALLESATRQGARALGFDADYGTIEPGKRARLLAVDVPAGDRRCGRIPGVGIEPDQIRWIDGLRDCRLRFRLQIDAIADRMSRMIIELRSAICNVEAVRVYALVRPLQPFGVRAAVCAGRRAAGGAARAGRRWRDRSCWILVAMVAARSAAMGFNRLVDARFDALNPRTANRELPRGAMSRPRGRRRSSSSRRSCSSSPRGG